MYVSDRVRGVLRFAPSEAEAWDPAWTDASQWCRPPSDASLHVTTAEAVRTVAASVRDRARDACGGGEGKEEEGGAGGGGRSHCSYYPTPWVARSLDEGVLRRHQRDALKAMRFSSEDGPASGWWIMPCGSGKTMAAAAAATYAPGPVLWVVPSMDTFPQIVRAFSAVQGAQQGARAVRKLAEATAATLLCLNPSTLDADREAVWVVTWRGIATHFQRPQRDATVAMLAGLECQRFAMVVLDEAHMQPATTHSLAVRRLRADVKLAMTACTARADARHGVASGDVGPVLHVTTHEQAVAAGLVVSTPRRWLLVVPAHPKTSLALKEAAVALAQDGAVGTSSVHAQSLACCRDTHKLWALQTLVVRQRHRKTIVYCDRLEPTSCVVSALEAVPGVVVLGAVDGATPRAARDAVIRRFVAARSGVVVFSHTGSASLDIPDLACIVEFGLVDGAVQKGVQRAGRLARTHADKPVAPEYYTLVCRDTAEHAFALRRKKGMCDAGEAGEDEGVVHVAPQKPHFVGREVGGEAASAAPLATRRDGATRATDRDRGRKRKRSELLSRARKGGVAATRK